MSKRIIYTIVFVALMLALFAPFSDIAISAETEWEPQFSIVFKKGDVFKDLNGTTIDLPESSKLDGTVTPGPGFYVWRDKDGAWRWFGGGSGGDVSVDDEGYLSTDKDDDTYFSEFNDKMRKSGARMSVRFPLPPDVKKQIDSGRSLIIAISAGKGWDESGELDIDRLFPPRYRPG